MEVIKQWYPIVLQVIGVAALIATMTANKTDNKIVNALLKIVNLLGANFGLAKNKDK